MPFVLACLCEKSCCFRITALCDGRMQEACQDLSASSEIINAFPYYS